MHGIKNIWAWWAIPSFLLCLASLLQRVSEKDVGGSRHKLHCRSHRVLGGISLLLIFRYRSCLVYYLLSYFLFPPSFFIFVSHAPFLFLLFFFFPFLQKLLHTEMTTNVLQPSQQKRLPVHCRHLSVSLKGCIWKERKGRKCLEHWVSRGGTWASHISIACKLVRNADFQASPQISWISNSKNRAQWPSRQLLMHYQDENHWSKKMMKWRWR